MEDQKPAESIIQTENSQDRITKTRTLYDVGVVEIFWKNMIAGFARTVGGLLIYGVFLIIISGLVAQVIMPQLGPLIKSYQEALNNFNQIGSPKSNSINQSLNVDELLQNPSLQKMLNKPDTQSN